MWTHTPGRKGSVEQTAAAQFDEAGARLLRWFTTANHLGWPRGPGPPMAGKFPSNRFCYDLLIEREQGKIKKAH